LGIMTLEILRSLPNAPLPIVMTPAGIGTERKF
jgi:hypothetical protein